jgi:hypothetical protein
MNIFCLHLSTIQIQLSIARESIESFAEYLSLHDVAYDVIMNDIGSIIAEQNSSHYLQPSSFQVNDFAYDKYHSIEDIHSWIDQMVQTYPSLASSFVVGQSYQNRNMKGLKISSSKLAVKLDGTPVNQKKAVWWDGGERTR